MAERRFKPINSGTFIGASRAKFKGGDDDHVYLQFFADAADQNTRSGYMGFGSAASEVFQFVLDGYSSGSFRFRNNVNIDTDGAGPMLDLGDGVGADGDTLLRLNADRAWSFKQAGTGASTALQLQTATDNKLLHLTDSGGTDRFTFTLSTTQNANSAKMPVLALVDGITAPSTVSGHAVLYVDTADGDLKVKFGDGTVKTIATDT